MEKAILTAVVALALLAVLPFLTAPLKTNFQKLACGLSGAAVCVVEGQE